VGDFFAEILGAIDLIDGKEGTDEFPDADDQDQGWTKFWDMTALLQRANLTAEQAAALNLMLAALRHRPIDDEDLQSHVDQLAPFRPASGSGVKGNYGGKGGDDKKGRRTE